MVSRRCGVGRLREAIRRLNRAIRHGRVDSCFGFGNDCFKARGQDDVNHDPLPQPEFMLYQTEDGQRVGWGEERAPTISIHGGQKWQ